MAFEGKAATDILAPCDVDPACRAGR